MQRAKKNESKSQIGSRATNWATLYKIQLLSYYYNPNYMQNYAMKKPKKFRGYAACNKNIEFFSWGKRFSIVSD